jgi:hypothetical protein
MQAADIAATATTARTQLMFALTVRQMAKQEQAVADLVAGANATMKAMLANVAGGKVDIQA